MTDMEQVWERLKDRAALHAESGVFVSISDARRIVRYICRDHDNEGAGDEAAEYLAGELVRLTRQADDLLHRRRRKAIRGIA